MEKRIGFKVLIFSTDRFALLENVQSVHFLDDIENCDLTLQVLDGILCHNGEVHSQDLRPNRCKDWDYLDKEIEDISKNWKKDYRPMTLEGCVVRFSDTIAYVGRDVQDAIEVGILGDTSLIPENCREILVTTNDEIINTLILDVIENSQDDDKISYSCEVSDALEKLKKK